MPKSGSASVASLAAATTMFASPTPAQSARGGGIRGRFREGGYRQGRDPVPRRTVPASGNWPLPATCHPAAQHGADRGAVIAVHWVELEEAGRRFATLTRVCDTAAVLRAHSDYRTPERMRAAILAVLTREGFMQPGRPQ
jgi:hypothetical protein